MDTRTSSVPTSSAGVDGQLLMLGFALMPNRLGYCGGPDQRELRDYYVAGAADAGLARLLHRFDGAMPYLRLIAAASYGVSGGDDQHHLDASGGAATSRSAAVRGPFRSHCHWACGRWCGCGSAAASRC